MKFGLFRTIYNARKPADWMMISTENIYVIFSLNSHENGTENTLSHPHVKIIVDKKRYLQTAVKDKYIIIAVRGCTNIQCYLKGKKISIDLH